MERRDGLALAAAIALHVALLVARPKIVAVATPTPPVTGVIELYEQPPSPAPTPVEPGARVAEPREPAAPVAAEPGSAAGSRVTPSPGAEPRAAAGDTAPHGDTPPGDPPPGDPPPAGTAQTPDLSRPPPPGGGPSLPPGLGGTPVWALPGVLRPMGGPLPAPTAAPAPRPTDRRIAGKVIDGTLRSRDHALGLDAPAAGVVASTIAGAVRSSAVPGDARATFEVRIGPAGDVRGVKLVSATAGDGPAWDRVVKSARGSLAGRSLRAGDGKGGTTVTVKIESKVQYPAGNKVKIETEPVCLNEVIDQITAALQDPGSIGAGAPIGGSRGAALGAGFTPPPGYAWDEQRRKFCIPIGIRGRGDLSNLAAHRQTVVRSSFSVKRDGERALPSEDILPIDTRVPWAKEDPTLRKPPPKKKKKRRGARK